MPRRSRASARSAPVRRWSRSAASTTGRSARGSPIVDPDALIVQDVTLVHQVDLFAGLHADGYILINSTRSFDDLGLGELAARFRHERMLTVPATELALRCIGVPIPNTVLLGGLCAFSGIIALDALAAAVRARFPAAQAEANITAAREAHAWVTTEMQELAHAPAD